MPIYSDKKEVIFLASVAMVSVFILSRVASPAFAKSIADYAAKQSSGNRLADNAAKSQSQYGSKAERNHYNKLPVLTVPKPRSFLQRLRLACKVFIQELRAS